MNISRNNLPEFSAVLAHLKRLQLPAKPRPKNETLRQKQAALLRRIAVARFSK